MENWSVVFADGVAKGNPGPASLGVAIFCDVVDRDVESFSNISDAFIVSKKAIGVATNNQAEYQSLIVALQLCVSNHLMNCRIYMDSLLIVNQMLGSYKVKHPHLKPLYNQAKELEKQLEKVELQHIKREYNHLADMLANQALKEV